MDSPDDWLFDASSSDEDLFGEEDLSGDGDGGSFMAEADDDDLFAGDVDTNDRNKRHDSHADASAIPMVGQFPGSVQDMSPASRKQLIRQRIEDVLAALSQQLRDGHSHLHLELRPIEHLFTPVRNPPFLTLSFPGRTAEDSWRFSVVVKILDLIKQTLSAHMITTKRDLYYQDPELFGNQTTVDRYCDLIARSLGVVRADLNICAAAKGLLAGAAIFSRLDGGALDLAAAKDSVIMPSPEEFLAVDLMQARFILVVEKEATYKSILECKLWPLLRQKCVMLTGKGYPDLATRKILHRLSCPDPWNRFRDLPVHVLTDFDPDGIAIAGVYRSGSDRLSHENKGIIVTKARRQGLSSHHIVSIIRAGHEQGFLPLSKRDRRLSQRMLEQQRYGDAGDMHDLQLMLMLNCKAELQILDKIGALEDMLSSL